MKWILGMRPKPGKTIRIRKCPGQGIEKKTGIQTGHANSSSKKALTPREKLEPVEHPVHEEGLSNDNAQTANRNNLKIKKFWQFMVCL